MGTYFVVLIILLLLYTENTHMYAYIVQRQPLFGRSRREGCFASAAVVVVFVAYTIVVVVVLFSDDRRSIMPRPLGGFFKYGSRSF